MSARTIRRGEVYLVDLGLGRGREIRKPRPCVVVSPDELNSALGTVMIAPLTTGAHGYLFRVACRFAGRDGHVVLDQFRSVDRARLSRKLGALTGATLGRCLETLRSMFAA